jgi:PII-like signaling protein
MPTRLVPAKRLTIHLTRADHFRVDGRPRHTPLGTELVLRAHKAGLAGAATLPGVQGFGHSLRVHRQPVWGLVDHAPILVMIVDTADRIDDFIESNQGLFRECLATVSDLRLVVRTAGS